MTAGLHYPGPQRGGENREDHVQHGGGRRREKWKKRDGETGARYKWQRLIEMVGGIVLRPYMPRGMKKIGNRWVTPMSVRTTSRKFYRPICKTQLMERDTLVCFDIT